MWHCLAVPMANVGKLTRVLIDACCKHLSLVNYGVTGRKLTEFLSDVDKSSPLSTRAHRRCDIPMHLPRSTCHSGKQKILKLRVRDNECVVGRIVYKHISSCDGTKDVKSSLQPRPRGRNVASASYN